MCQCGKVKFEHVAPPILAAPCYCTSCQEAGRQFEQLASAPPVLDSDSGTGLILYRKDRVQACILKKTGSRPIPPPDGASPNAVIRQCSSTSPRDTGCRCSGTAFRQARLHLKCG